MSDTTHLTVVTTNAGRGKGGSLSDLQVLGQALAQQNADFVGLQELIVVRRRWRTREDTLRQLQAVVARVLGEHAYRAVFEPAVDTDRHPLSHPGKWSRGIFAGCDYGAQGNGFLIQREWRVLDTRSETISNLGPFMGDRNTEPRSLLVVSAVHSKTGCRVIAACTHLTTLKGEHVSRQQKASQTRTAQVRRLLDFLNRYAGGNRQPVILLGDFNAVAEAPELQLLANGGFVRISGPPYCSDHHLDMGTRHEFSKFIDHVWFRPANRLLGGACWLLDSRALRQASDHRPVVARLRLRPCNWRRTL